MINIHCKDGHQKDDKQNSKQANPSGAPCGGICCVSGHLQ
jgi:hypothetical protein